MYLWTDFFPHFFLIEKLRNHNVCKTFPKLPMCWLILSLFLLYICVLPNGSNLTKHFTFITFHVAVCIFISKKQTKHILCYLTTAYIYINKFVCCKIIKNINNTKYMEIILENLIDSHTKKKHIEISQYFSPIAPGDFWVNPNWQNLFDMFFMLLLLLMHKLRLNILRTAGLFVDNCWISHLYRFICRSYSNICNLIPVGNIIWTLSLSL